VHIQSVVSLDCWCK